MAVVGHAGTVDAVPNTGVPGPATPAMGQPSRGIEARCANGTRLDTSGNTDPSIAADAVPGAIVTSQIAAELGAIATWPAQACFEAPAVGFALLVARAQVPGGSAGVAGELAATGARATYGRGTGVVLKFIEIARAAAA